MSHQPSDWAMGEAIQVVQAALCGHQNQTNLLLILPKEFRSSLETAIALALDAARKVPDGFVRLPDGRDVKVLGTLPMTADGCVVGNHVALWINDVGEVTSLRVDNIGCSERVGGDEAFWEVGECYSTRENAAKSRGEQE